MNSSKILSLFLTLALGALASTASAQAVVARYIPYKGQLERDGALASGPVSITFQLWDAASGGAMLHSESQAVSVVAGNFSARIGPVAESVFDASALHIALVVEGVPLGGRQLVQTAPFAVRGQPGQPFRADSVVIAGNGQSATLAPGTNGAALDISGGDVAIQGNLVTPRLSAFNVIANGNTSNLGGGFFETTFSDPGGTLLMHVSTSAYCATAGRIAVSVLVDGVLQSRMRTYCHTTFQHITMPATLFELNRNTIPNGFPLASAPVTRTLRIEPINCTSGCTAPLVTTSVDGNDFVEATIIRLPAF